ncbi:hypothetical protein Tco_0159496 [Tanacetum coccineum]
MAMTIQYGVRGLILEAQSEAFKQENILVRKASWVRLTYGKEGGREFVLYGPYMSSPRVEKDIATYVSNCRICFGGECCNVKDFCLAATA